MNIREQIDKWVLISFLVLGVLLSVELARVYSSMNPLQVAGLVFDILLTLGLLAIYWEMSGTQEKQMKIMDKQENLMAANHTPRIQIYHHEVLTAEDRESSIFAIINEGEGPAKNLRTRCEVLLAEETEPLPYLTSMESFNIHCPPEPLIKFEEKDSFRELSGSTWLSQFEVAAFYGELKFLRVDFDKVMSEVPNAFKQEDIAPAETEIEILSFKEIMEGLPLDEADMVYLKFYIYYEYGDGRKDNKEAPIYAISPEVAKKLDTLSEAVEKGEWRPHLPTAFRSNHGWSPFH